MRTPVWFAAAAGPADAAASPPTPAATAAAAPPAAAAVEAEAAASVAAAAPAADAAAEAEADASVASTNWPRRSTTALKPARPSIWYTTSETSPRLQGRKCVCSVWWCGAAQPATAGDLVHNKRNATQTAAKDLWVCHEVSSAGKVGKAGLACAQERWCAQDDSSTLQNLPCACKHKWQDRSHVVEGGGGLRHNAKLDGAGKVERRHDSSRQQLDQEPGNAMQIHNVVVL